MLHGPNECRQGKPLSAVTKLLVEGSKWSPPPMSIRNARGITSKLPTSWVEIEYLKERGVGRWSQKYDYVGENGVILKGWATGPFTYWTKGDSKHGHFTSLFCESVVSHRSCQPVFVGRSS
ncbi:hypothetical protein EVAR_11682_1 [Eumeta japonica]|uniref:Uncharacterized protein n=1 Tax=Eumeta variegata TaxID=151549 RepID=A0A4C1U594_EUMVA|nr:hypothetical protein EVAR_11682_1 [Eumeta japonica]